MLKNVKKMTYTLYTITKYTVFLYRTTSNYGLLRINLLIYFYSDSFHC